jgi:hypothetical protein
MKKLIPAVLLSFSFIIFPPAKVASAIELSAGASTWYCWWKNADDEKDMKLSPAFLYGPVLSMRFDESWSLAGVILYGEFTPKDKDRDRSPDSVSRYDSDLSLNYNINRYFKIFSGGKFMGFTWKAGHTDGTHWSAGPGLGIGSTLPLTESLYLLINLSGTYSWGKDVNTTNDNGVDVKNRNKIKERSISTSLSFAYYFSSASTSVNLGFRYHYLNINSSNKQDDNDTNNFFGPTFSVVYSF